jgi:predicted transcriptional regulator
MSAAEIIEQFKALSPEDQTVVTKYILEHDSASIPQEFKEGMADAAASRFVNMETVLSGASPT